MKGDIIQVRTDDFTLDEAIQGLRSSRIGGIVAYLGTVRDLSQGKSVISIEFDVTGEVIASRLTQIVEKARGSFDIDAVAIIHRIGKLMVGEKILLVAVSAAHREPAFAACQYVIDNIKAAHTLWQKEVVTSAEI